ncbi:MAG TPA: SRPBCC family protein [Planctomycetota bacterium]|nr:SRPBCC family protein [Planctomycetota bacterium]
MDPTNEEVPADRQIVTTRILEAPRELVWKVWTDPQHVLQWWGPTGFTTTTHHMDVRPGGQWRFTMHGPDGHDYENWITFLEVQAPSRLVYAHGGDTHHEEVDFRTTVTFEALPGESGRTRLTMRAVFSSSKVREFVIREYNAAEGGKQTLARLAGHVEALARGTRDLAVEPFAMRRVVGAPRELVYRVWTEREHLAKWFGPPGCTLGATSLDLRPGGVFHYCMRFPGAPDSWGKWVFREITPPERLVFVVSFADERGASIRAPWDATWPLEMLATVTFEPHAGIGKGTVITLQSSAHDASPMEQRTFDDGHGSMTQGWAGTFDRLVDYLATAK